MMMWMVPEYDKKKSDSVLIFLLVEGCNDCDNDDRHSKMDLFLGMY